MPFLESEPFCTSHSFNDIQIHLSTALLTPSVSGCSTNSLTGMTVRTSHHYLKLNPSKMALIKFPAQCVPSPEFFIKINNTTIIITTNLLIIVGDKSSKPD